MPQKNSKDSKQSNGLAQSFAAAIRAAQSSPSSEDAWNHVEELADSLQDPDPVADLYRKVLGNDLTPKLRSKLAQRSVSFFEEWFGDNPEAMSSLLTQILESNPEAEWAFERLTVVLTVAEQWDALLDLYDRTLEQTKDKTRRRQLLDDAAHVAKDFAEQGDRAIDYMQQLLAIDPGNAQLASSVERLLERQGRWKDVIALWRNRIPALSTDEARSTRVRIAACCLDELDDPGSALDELRTLVDENPGHSDACQQLERILELEHAPHDVWREALALLRSNHDIAERPEALVAALEHAIARADDQERLTLHRETGSRLAILDKTDKAMDHYAALLLLEPTDADARKQLRQLAERSGAHERHAAALLAAAEGNADQTVQATLLVDAAFLYRTVLDDRNRAVELYSRVLDAPDAERFVALNVAHNLNELHAEAERPEERLAVLEKLSTLERTNSVRRSILGEAARLADELGDSARALAAYNAVLEINENDLAALDAIVDLLSRAQKYDELISALLRRSAAPVRSLQRRADLVWIARLQAEQLQDASAAMDTWLGVREEFGDDDEVTAALDDLLGSASRWSELAELLEKAAAGQRARASGLLSRLGDIHHKELEQPERATDFLTQAIALDPLDETSRAGLRALVKKAPACAEKALEALARAYSTTDDWQLLLEILEARLEVQANASNRVRILREAAGLHEKRGDNTAAALRVLAVAFGEDPTDTTIEQELMRLAEKSSDWAMAAAAHGEAAAALREHPYRAAHLRFAEGQILERQLNDPTAAVDAYSKVIENVPQHAEALSALVRVASQAEVWDVAARAAIASAHNRDSLEAHVVDQLERAVADARAWDSFADAMTTAVAVQEKVPPALATSIESQIATWHLQRRDDRKAAEAAAERALSHSTADKETLLLLADLQRPAPGPGLVDTLLRLDALTNDNLDMLREAAAIALQSPESASTAAAIIERLYQKASGMWMRSEQTQGEHDPEATTVWALEHLVDACAAAGDSDRAVRLLVDGVQLPFEQSTANSMRQRAADALGEAGETGRAIELYRTVLEETPTDLEAIQRLAALCHQSDRLPELIALRRRELSIVEDKQRQLELRLEISERVGILEERGGRVELLLRNLDEEPGHAASIEALCGILDSRGRHQELASILSDQAVRLLHEGEAERSCVLWTRVAEVAENSLQDVDGAILAYGQVVEHGATNQALDALARLHLQRDEPAEAAEWLQRRLETAGAKQRVAIILKLARAQIRADQHDAAIAPLEAAFEEAPRNAEVRKLLMRLYRQAEMWEPLAEALTTATDHIADNDTILAYAREAGALYSEKLGKPELAVAALEKGHSIDPTDRQLRVMLAEGLRAEGRLDEARVLLEGLIEDFGRRRSAERAQVHLALARVMRAQEDKDAAIDQLELAYKMDAGNTRIVRALAELARDCKEYKRAEAAYRALLLIVRRGQADDDAEPIGASEVLLELSQIARERGQDAQAEELLESAFGALSQNDDEAPALQATLLARDEIDLLRRVLETRLESVESPKRRADVLSDLADLLENRLERPEEALDARLRSVESDPGSPPRHHSARELALSLDALDRYAELVERLLDKAQRDTDAHVRCELVLRLAEIMEHRDDLERAAELCAEAESTGVREVDVWRAAARVAGARGDTEEQMRLLGQLASLGEDEAGSESRVDALYRLAEVQLASTETANEGMASLSRALEEDPRYERAGIILGRATQEETTDDDLLALYEQVARKSGDDRMVLQYLERRTMHATGTAEHAREAVDVAVALGEKERAEALMLRAVDIGQDALDGLESVAWAMLGLAENCKQAGDLAGAVKWLGEAAEVAEPERLFELGSEVAALAGTPDGDLTLAAKLYERLLERDPTAREAWQPLAELHMKLGNHEALDRLVEETLDGLQDPADRNWLRLQRATMLLGIETRREDAVDVLREILMEDPEHYQATELLADYFAEVGNTDDLIDLLRNGLMAAQSRDDPEAVAAASLRLGRHLEETDPEEALAVYQSALESAPTNHDLLQAVLEHTDVDEDPQEAAEIMERLLAVETGQRAAELTGMLVAIHESRDDEEATLRALQQGFQRSPGDEALRQRLEETYRARGDHAGVAQMLLGVAQTIEDPEARLATIREAAAIHRDTLSDPAAAVEILRQAAEAAPDDVSVSFELATTLSAAGDHEDAIACISRVLEAAREDEALRLDALRLRAKMRRAIGDEAAARADLEEAYALDALAVAPELEEILRRQRSLTAAGGDRDLERAITLRLVEILLVQAQSERARDLLEQWVDQDPKDVEFIYMLRDIDSNDQRWEALAKTCSRLISIAEGEEQIDAGLRLAYACEQAGKPEDARSGLEQVLQSQPGHTEIRNELRQVYERSGAKAPLARMLLQDSESIEDGEKRIAVLRRAGELLLSTADAKAAIPVYVKILALEPGDHETTLALADAHIVAGDLDQADAMVDEGIEARRGRRSPELAMLQHRKAAIAEGRGDVKQRLNWLEQAFACDKNNGYVVAEVAELAEHLEKWDLAVKAFRTLALMESGSPISRGQAFLGQGRIALRKGDRKRAVLWARKARQEEPDLEDIAAFLAEIGDR